MMRAIAFRVRDRFRHNRQRQPDLPGRHGATRRHVPVQPKLLPYCRAEPQPGEPHRLWLARIQQHEPPVREGEVAFKPRYTTRRR